MPGMYARFAPRSIIEPNVFSTLKTSDLSPVFIRHRIVKSVSSDSPLRRVTCRDRTDSTDITSEGISFGEIDRVLIV